jgi:hypothetical protein
MNTLSNESSSQACHLMAILSETREEHGATAPQIFALAQEVQELSDGYSTRLLNEPGSFMAIAKFIENERLCRFTLDIP